MPLSFLLIDDNPIDLLINEKMIKSYIPEGEIIKKGSAEEALEYLSSSKASIPQIILLDIKMPVMDGFEFIEEYKKINNPELGEVKIYMLSSSIDPEDIRRCENEDIVLAFLEKPLNVDQLKKRIVDL